MRVEGYFVEDRMSMRRDGIKKNFDRRPQKKIRNIEK